MKCRLAILGQLFCLFVSAQTSPIIAKVYSWDTSATNKIIIRNIFSGSGTILSLHEINGIILPKGKSITYKGDSNGNELFFIIKNGPVTVNLNNQSYSLNRGSVVVVLPGDKISIKNTGDKVASFYEMKYYSKEAPNAERGKKAGESFVMNWNDMVFKPHDKGGVRQLFDRQTSMLNRFDIHVTQLNAGFKSHEPHTHKNEEIILMLDGNAEMQIGTDHPKANSGDVEFLTSLIPHNLTNIGKIPCLYFAIQWN